MLGRCRQADNVAHALIDTGQNGIPKAREERRLIRSASLAVNAPPREAAPGPDNCNQSEAIFKPPELSNTQCPSQESHRSRARRRRRDLPP